MFWNIFYKLCEEKSIKPNAVAKVIGVSNATCTKWKNGAVPNGETLLKLADYLNVSVDYLLGRTENSQTINSNNVVNFSNSGDNNTNNVSIGKASSEDISEITEMIKKLSLIERSKVILFIEEMKGKNAKC